MIHENTETERDHRTPSAGTLYAPAREAGFGKDDYSALVKALELMATTEEHDEETEIYSL